jgi:LPS sulfotransferase NodH
LFYRHLSPDYFHKLVDPSLAPDDRQDRFQRCSDFIDANYDRPTVYKRFRETWEFLVADQRLAVIHLRRRNILDTLISHKTAVITGQWWRVGRTERETTRIHLERDECCRYFETVDGLVERNDAIFAGHAKLDVVYETLLDRRRDVLGDIFAFLGVPYREVSTRMLKQTPMRAAERLDNYAELKRTLGPTKWGVFFEE